MDWLLIPHGECVLPVTVYSYCYIREPQMKARNAVLVEGTFFCQSHQGFLVDFPLMRSKWSDV